MNMFFFFAVLGILAYLHTYEASHKKIQPKVSNIYVVAHIGLKVTGIRSAQ